MKTTTCSVTGAFGFLGSHVVEQMLEAGRHVVAVDDFSWGRRENLSHLEGHPRLTVAVGDVCEEAYLLRLFARHKPVAVVHLAAVHFIPAAEADPPRTVSLNVGGTQTVLTAAQRAGVETVWFASSGDVYAPAEAVHAEHAPLKPFNIYGLSKLMAEQLVQTEAAKGGPCRFIIGRLFNLYGPRETNPHIIPEILSQLRRRPEGPLRLGNLEPRRDLVPVEEAARAVIASLDRAPEGLTIVNVATGVAWPMSKVVDILGEILGRPLSVEVDPTKARAIERPHLQADVSRLRQLIGWTPHADLRRGLANLLQHEGIR